MTITQNRSIVFAAYIDYVLSYVYRKEQNFRRKKLTQALHIGRYALTKFGYGNVGGIIV